MYFFLKEMFFLSVAVLYTHKYAGAGAHAGVYRGQRKILESSLSSPALSP